MKDETKARLKQMIVAYDEKLADIERVAEAKRAAQAAFPERFTALKQKTLHPALQEFADLLNASGHVASVNERDASSTTETGVQWATISLRVVPRPFAKGAAHTSPSAVELTFSANRNDGKVTVSSTNTISNAGGSLGKRGGYEIDALTSDVVAEHVLQALQEAFGGMRP
jgi:hypothetical protein